MEFLYDIAQGIMWEAAVSSLTLTDFNEDGLGWESLYGRIETDAMDRVSLLEKGNCPSPG